MSANDGSTGESNGPPRDAVAAVLVTGARGLLAQALIRRLRAEGRVVRGIDLPTGDSADVRSGIAAGDLIDKSSSRDACEGVKTIIHTAARQYHGAPQFGRRAHFAANAAMTRTLIHAATAAGVRHIVFVSSDMVYGMPRGRAFSESDEPRPIGPYGASKLVSERICEAARDAGICVTILRPRLIIGAGRLGVLRTLFERVRRSAAVPMIGNGENRYQMVAVADVAAACCDAIARPVDGVFNLGSSDPPPVRELLTALARRAGSRSRLFSLPVLPTNAALRILNWIGLAPLAPEQYRIASVDYVLDTQRARTELGWRPRFSDSDMLFAAYDAYVRSLGLTVPATPKSVDAETLGTPDGRNTIAPRAPAISSAPVKDA